MHSKHVFTFLFLFFAVVSAMTQVDYVNYHLRYNKSTCLYECCLIITQGSATTAIERLQANSQFSFIVPTGSTVTIAQNHNPIQGNINYTGTKPMVWDFGSVVINPAALPGSDIYGVVPTLSPTSFYNNLNTGDTVRLFSIAVSPVVNCGNGIRLFNNITDPRSHAPGMNGGDFSNGFSIGGSDPNYAGNAESVHPSKPTIFSLNASCANGLKIELNASTNNCQTPLSYAWSGPDGYTSTLKDVNLSNATFVNNGLYLITVSDALGCTQSASVSAYAKPNAGNNQSVSCYSSGTATISASSGIGSWSIGNTSAGTAIIANATINTTTVSGFSLPGNYLLIWSSNSCSDTTILAVGNNCLCSVYNYLNVPNEQLFCTVSTNVLIDGNTTTGSPGSYQWIRKLNNQNYINAPGVSSEEDYQVGALSTGIYQFRRIFTSTALPTCSDTSNFVTVQVLTKPNAGADQILNCVSADTAFVATSSPGQWSIGQGSGGNATLSAISPLNINITKFSTAGTYYVLRSNAACADTSVITVHDWCECDYAFAGPDRSKCAGDTIVLNSHCNIGVWSAVTSNPMGATLTPLAGGKVLVQFIDLAMGDFKFVYTTLNQTTDTVKFTMFAKPVVSLGEDFGFCEGGESAIITANGGMTYLWSTGQTTSSLLISPTATTTYSVTGTDNNGCKGVDAILVTLFEKPDGNIPAIPPVFEYDPLQVNAGNWTNAMEYEWLGPHGFASVSPNNMIPSATIANAGMYILYVRSPDDCITISSVMVEVYERALSVQLVSFQGHYDKVTEANKISWVTSSEINNEYFTLERSSDDGQTYLPLADIPAHGHGSIEYRYNYDDKDLSAGNVYLYRLKQVDTDRTYKYSKTILIKVDGLNEAKVRYFPNPARDYLFINIEGFDSGKVECSIYSTTGSLVYFGEWYHDGNRNLLLPDFKGDQLPSGMYYISTKMDGVENKQKLMIIK